MKAYRCKTKIDFFVSEMVSKYFFSVENSKLYFNAGLNFLSGTFPHTF